MSNPNGRGRLWTRRELARGVMMRLDGLPYAEIAIRLGRTTRAVECTLCKELVALGFVKSKPHREWTARELQDAVTSSLRGESMREIALRLDRTIPSVANAVFVYYKKRGRVRQERRYRRGELVALVRRFARPGVSDADIGKILGCHRTNIVTIRHRHGIPSGFTQGTGRPPKIETRPPGHKWKPGELTTCLIRLMALNDGMGIPHEEMARHLNWHRVASIRTMVGELLKGVKV